MAGIAKVWTNQKVQFHCNLQLPPPKVCFGFTDLLQLAMQLKAFLFLPLLNNVNYKYVPLILDHDINNSDGIDELVDHDMFQYLEPPTYYYARAMNIDDGEERAYCFICCLEIQNEDILIVTLPYEDAFHVDCVKDQLRRRNAVVLLAHEEIVEEEEEEEEEDEFEDEEIVEEKEEEEKFEVEISTYNALKLDIEKEACVICLLDYKEEDIIGTLKCGHEFHAGCVKKWLLQKNACPFCRASV
ncbi:PREDICTED: E3 ubiquitin ligase BIG BROTHER-like [Nicotiana attenuata]|uniref:E3 ubiquitin ligase BIG BROTHER-like n=1 Tax=Nicotiana attenuata TaxID=49451 RepID=UPI0009055E5A|nr:PREDICTED: E3 ubiquitin ligase BIG BROTHER-like [Nicotiana attenuata]